MFVPGAALIALREGLEALLVLSILVGLVVKLGRPEARRFIALGAAAAVLLSVALGFLVDRFLRGAFEQGGGEAFELAAALAAVVVLTYMVVWMYRHTRELLGALHARVREALDRDRMLVLGLLAFLTVLREGLETVLFYAALAPQNTAVDLAWSGAVGFAVSGVLAYALFRSSVRLSLTKFFGLTGVLLVFVAGGLIVHSVDAGMDLGLLPPAEPMWDTSAWLPNDAPTARVLHAFVGYDDSPTALQGALYALYVLGFGGWYVASLGAFRAGPRLAGGRIPARAAAGLVAVLLVLVVLGAGAAGAFRTGAPLQTASADDAPPLRTGAPPPADEPAPMALPDGVRVGVLYRTHGEPPLYNATTYASFTRFGREILETAGLEALLAVDQGTVLLNRRDPYGTGLDVAPDLMDAWLQSHPGPAVPLPDAASLTGAQALGLLGAYHLAPGPGPGLGEPDILEMWGLGTWLEWEKMGGASPQYEGERAIKERAVQLLRAKYGDALEVRFAYMVNPHMHPRGEIAEAAEDLARARVQAIVDHYGSSVHSDAMNTCMMRPHADHALEQAGFEGPVVRAGMAGFEEAWASAVAQHAGAMLARLEPGSDVALFLSQHGASPERANPCGEGPDQYFANTQREFGLARAAVERLGWPGRLGIYHVFAQGGEGDRDPDDRALSPGEALERARADGFAQVLDVPYDAASNGFDNLVVLREAYGFTHEQAPYHDAAFETRFERDGLQVLITTAAFSVEWKARAHFAVLDAAVQEALAALGPRPAEGARPGEGPSAATTAVRTPWSLPPPWPRA